MPNNLETLSWQLAVQLRDTDEAVWTENERDSLVTWAVNLMYPKVVRPVTDTIACIVNEDTYPLDISIRKVFRVDLLDSEGRMVKPLQPGTWEVRGDRNDTATALDLFINRSYSIENYSFVVHGYGIYNFSGALPPDRVVPLILARARSEAYRRMGSDRVQFRQWANANERSDTSVNELLQMIREADNEAVRLEQTLRLGKKPMPGRI